MVDQRAEEGQPDRLPLSAVEGAQDRGYGAQVPAHHHRLQQLLQACVPSALRKIIELNMYMYHIPL